MSASLSNRQAPNHTSVPSVDQGYAQSIQLTRARARNFYYAFVTLPPQARRAICALYAYCRRLDDIADGEGAAEEKLKQIEQFENGFNQALSGRPPSSLFASIAHAVQHYNIPKKHLQDVATGVKRDLVVTRYQTFDELKEYCYLVASSVGLACLEIFGYRNEKAHRSAVDLGIAMQLTNVLRDVREDAIRDRIYLPREDLSRFRISDRALLEGRAPEGFEEMMAFQISRARRYYDSASKLFQWLPRRSRPCPMVLHGVYSRLLSRIETDPSAVFRRRVALTSTYKAMLAAGLWFRGLLWPLP